MADQRTRQRWIFEGDVQGVGFRVTTREISARFDVVGFVRNNVDGSVTVEAEGCTSALNGFLAEIKSRLTARIEHCVRQDIETQKPSNREAAFVIK